MLYSRVFLNTQGKTAPSPDNTIAVAAVENDDTSKKGGKGRKEGVNHKRGFVFLGGSDRVRWWGLLG